MGLAHMALVERGERAFIERAWGSEFCAPALELVLGYAHVEASGLDIERDHVACPQQREPTAASGET